MGKNCEIFELFSLESYQKSSSKLAEFKIKNK